jgi:hypothetical protein
MIRVWQAINTSFAHYINQCVACQTNIQFKIAALDFHSHFRQTIISK